MSDLVLHGDPQHPVGNPDTHERPFVELCYEVIAMSFAMHEQLDELSGGGAEKGALVRDLIRESLTARGITPASDFVYEDGCIGYL